MISSVLLSMIKDGISTYPSGCSQPVPCSAQFVGYAQIVTEYYQDEVNCGSVYNIGDELPSDKIVPATTVQVVKLELAGTGGNYIFPSLASYNSNWEQCNGCCTPLPTLATPTAFTASNGDTESVTNWSDVANATNYILQMANNSSFTGATQIYSGSVSGYTKTGLTNGTQYWFRVKAQADGYNDSEWAVQTATPAP